MSNAKKKNDEARDVRTRILRTATRLFAAQGFDGTSLQTIADEVGVAKASLLYHFPSKEELRGAVLDQLLSHWNDVLPRLLEAATTGEHRFESLISEVVGFFTADADRARLLVREMLDRPDELEALFREYLGPWMTILSDYIRRGQQEGRVYPGLDPEAYILQIIHLVVGAIATGDVIGSLLDGSEEESEVASRQLDELIRIAHSSLFVQSESAPSTALPSAQ